MRKFDEAGKGYLDYWDSEFCREMPVWLTGSITTHRQGLTVSYKGRYLHAVHEDRDGDANPFLRVEYRLRLM